MGRFDLSLCGKSTTSIPASAGIEAILSLVGVVFYFKNVILKL